MKKQDNVTTKIKIYYIHRGDNVPFYIGKTSTSFNKRIYSHKKNFGENIVMEELDIISKDEWKFWESYWIEQFKSWGFNLKNKNKGGGGIVKHSLKSREKMEKTWAQKTSKELVIINEKRRKGNLGKAKPGAGRKPFTAQQKIDLGNRSYYKGESYLNKCRKPVFMLDKLTGEVIREFGSVNEAAYFIGVKQPSISCCLTGRVKTCGGYRWRYKNT